MTNQRASGTECLASMQNAKHCGRCGEHCQKPAAFGTYLPKEGRDPRARVEALRYQAAAHLAEQRGIDPMPYVSRAAELIGASSRAAADQAEL